jgi:hypothetical protein
VRAAVALFRYCKGFAVSKKIRVSVVVVLLLFLVVRSQTSKFNGADAMRFLTFSAVRGGGRTSISKSMKYSHNLSERKLIS